MKDEDAKVLERLGEVMIACLQNGWSGSSDDVADGIALIGRQAAEIARLTPRSMTMNQGADVLYAHNFWYYGHSDGHAGSRASKLDEFEIIAIAERIEREKAVAAEGGGR